MSYQDISPLDFFEAVTTCEFTIIDARDKSAFEQDSIPTAIHYQPNLPDDFELTMVKERPLLVYCYHGINSRKIAEMFYNKGFKQVYNLEGGWQAVLHYQSKNLPVQLRTWLVENSFRLHDLEAINSNNMTPLMLAAREGNLVVLKQLLDFGVDVNKDNYDGNTALWYACLNGEIKIVNLLIHYKSNVNIRNSHGTTPLMNAAVSGKFDVLLALVDAGAELHFETREGHSLLEISASREVTNYLEPLFQLKQTVIH